MTKTCCFPGCKSGFKLNSNKGDVKKKIVFSFPKNEQLLKCWITAIGQDVSLTNTKNKGVCEDHFDPSSFETFQMLTVAKNSVGNPINTTKESKRLEDGAVPQTLSESCKLKISKFI